ncbi:MAG TPA: AAA family ATPase [Roseiarcus sp.]|nr:AAA family ATPase [Roseiarcus sp.]
MGLDATEYAPLLAPLFDVPLPQERAAKFPPEELRRRQLTAMTALFMAGARSQPVILAFEDLHWADPTSLDLLRALAERGAQAPLFIIATTRPEFRAPWAMRSHHGVISLAPLDRAQVRRMVGEIAERHALSSDVIEGVGERTGGVPLFVEEVTRLLLERGEQGGAQAIPPTLQQSLVARLDRLGEARELAQISAILGRDFSYRLLRDVSSSAAGFDEPRLLAALDRLAEADLLFVDGAPPTAAYRFKHALIRDAAYDSLLKSRRQALNRCVAKVLLKAEAEPEAIAHHFTEAGVEDLAIEWWGKAGDQALRRSAFQEAISHLGRAIAMADKVGSPSRSDAARRSELTDRQFKLESTFAQAVGWAKDFGAEEAKVASDRVAHALATNSVADVERAIARQAHWATAFSRGEMASAREAAENFLKAAEGAATLPGLAAARRSMGATLLVQGDLAEASKFLEQALEIADRGRDRDRIFGTGPDPGASAAAHLSLACWILGAPERSRELINEVLARMERTEHIPTQTVVRYFAAVLEMLRGDARACLPLALSMIDFCRDRGVEQFLGAGRVISAWARARLQGADPDVLQFRQAVAAISEQGHRLYLPFYLGRLAEIEIAEKELGAAMSRIKEAQELARDTGQRVFDAFLERLLGEALLAANRADTSAAETALLASIEIARQQNARGFGLQAALTLARLYQSTGRPANAHTVLARALEGFAPTPEMPEIAEAQALLAGLSQTDEVKADAAQRRRMTHLHVAYGNALFAARGPGAPETTAAFATARDSSVGHEAASDRLAVDYGLWAGSYLRGELPSMIAHAETFLSDVKANPASPEAGIAHRVRGITHHFAGKYEEARRHLERALALFEPGRDDDLALRFGIDPSVGALAYLALASWPVGEVDRAASLVDGMQTRRADVSHVGTHTFVRLYAAMYELMRGDHVRAAPSVAELARLAREHDLLMWRAFGVFLEGWLNADSGAPDVGLESMRRGIELLREQSVLMFDGLLKKALAEAETRAGDPERALAILDEALTTCDRTGYRAFEAELRRARGEILLERDPSKPASAEAEFQAAIAVARRQGARAFALRAALSLAKLCQSTGRPVEAHDALAPALEGFSPTPEMPEIAEAEALLAALAETEEVKSAAALRRQRLHLQISYGKAVMWSRGYGAEETKSAFARAQELAAGIGDTAERFEVYYSQWAGCMVRGEPESARATAESFIRDAKNEGTPPDVAAACRTAGRACLSQGDFSQARVYLEEALRTCDPEWDDETRRRHGTDCEISATAYLAHVVWQFGEVELARQLIDHAISRAVELGHIPTLANAYLFETSLEMFRGDARATLRDAETLVELSGKNGLAYFLNIGTQMRGWARARLSDRDAGVAEMREAIRKFADQGFWGFVPHSSGRLAELEAEEQGAEGALAHIDEALALAQRTGEHWTDALLHRIRGDVLLKADPENPTRAEEAYLCATTIAQEQGARSFGLRAAVSLAKLYQSTGRPVEARDILAPALEGFSPTPEMPDIAEAQALLAALQDIDEVKADVAQRRRMTQLQAAYGAALISARGYGARETTEAFARARESAAGDTDAPERLAADYGLWAGSYVRGELPSMRMHAAAFVRDVEARPETPEAGIAHRVQGMTHYFAGEFVEAVRELERALALFQPGRDDDLAFRFPPDPGVASMIYLAFASWALGEAGRAVSFVERMRARIAELSHPPTLALGATLAAFFALLRGDRPRARTSVSELARIVRDYDLPLFRAFGEFLVGWATFDGGALADGLEAMRRGAESLRGQNAVVFDGVVKIALAEAEARGGDPERALAILEEALATCVRAGHRAFECELHRARGELLLRRHPADPAPAEDAWRTAVAIAQRQGAHGYELLASLPLARLYRSTGRPVEAHDILAPALEAFSPTPEMPEIEAAQALLAALKRETPLPTGEGQG